MGFEFRTAKRENVNLLIGVAGASGSGKTYSALRLASGIADGKAFAVIDTENGRAKHYADSFAFDSCELHEPFTPERYADAIMAADKLGYPVIVVDSMSHSWAGVGGCLDMQEAEFNRLGGRDSVKMLSWAKPKLQHKAMVSRLLQVRAHLILCFRAEEKIEMVKGKDGKVEIVKKETLTGKSGWVPICEKNLPYELTISALLTCDQPGVPQWIKIQEQHKALFPSGSHLDEAAGARILEWSNGGEKRVRIPPGSEQHRINVLEWTDLINACTSIADLQELWKSCFVACKEKNDTSAYEMLTPVKDAKKVLLSGGA